MKIYKYQFHACEFHKASICFSVNRPSDLSDAHPVPYYVVSTHHALNTESVKNTFPRILLSFEPSAFILPFL